MSLRRCSAASRTATSRAAPTSPPTVVAELPRDDWIWSDELFVPLVAVRRSTRSTRRSTLANDTPLGLTAGFFSDGPRRDRRVPRTDRGRRRLREPPRRRDHRRVARRPAVRRLEGLGHQRQGGRRPVLRAAVPARAVPDGGRSDMTGLAVSGPRLDPRRPRPDVRHRLARAAGQSASIERDQPGHQPVDAARLPARARRGRGLVIEDVDGNLLPRLQRGHRGHLHRPLPPRGRRRHPAAGARRCSTTRRATSTCRSTRSCASALAATAPIAGPVAGRSSPTRAPRPSRRAIKLATVRDRAAST